MYWLEVSKYTSEICSSWAYQIVLFTDFSWSKVHTLLTKMRWCVFFSIFSYFLLHQLRIKDNLVDNSRSPIFEQDIIWENILNAFAASVMSEIFVNTLLSLCLYYDLMQCPTWCEYVVLTVSVRYSAIETDQILQGLGDFIERTSERTSAENASQQQLQCVTNSASSTASSYGTSSLNWVVIHQLHLPYRPWRTLIRFSRSRHFWSQLSQKRCVLGTKFLWHTNSKLYAMTLSDLWPGFQCHNIFKVKYWKNGAS